METELFVFNAEDEVLLSHGLHGSPIHLIYNRVPSVKSVKIRVILGCLGEFGIYSERTVSAGFQSALLQSKGAKGN
jgi:hypothetical protein